MLNQRIDRSIGAQALPFLRVLVSRAMSNPTLANRLVCAVVPHLSEFISPELETKNFEATDVGGSSQRKGKKRARGYEGDGVFWNLPSAFFEVLNIPWRYGCCHETQESHQKSTRYHQGFYSRHSFASRGFLPRIQKLRIPQRNFIKTSNACIELASAKSTVLRRTLPLLRTSQMKA